MNNSSLSSLLVTLKRFSVKSACKNRLTENKMNVCILQEKEIQDIESGITKQQNVLNAFQVKNLHLASINVSNVTEYCCS